MGSCAVFISEGRSLEGGEAGGKGRVPGKGPRARGGPGVRATDRARGPDPGPQTAAAVTGGSSPVSVKASSAVRTSSRRSRMKAGLKHAV
ncbi:hypothetical protein GCM10010285_47260 [Streptomyces pseudogriseolus]|uniref:Uncharacterized protein n=1 Tax=Streptomyces pseudogriseolus TaxID=36817 RepID=A0ABQ2TBP8_STREZ|nr:hypothetical protein GCM10010285_47260 [Streptomyces rubiginosus]